MWCFQISYGVLNAQKLSYLWVRYSLGQLMWSHGACLLLLLHAFFRKSPSHPIAFAWWCGLIIWCIWNIDNQILMLIRHNIYHRPVFIVRVPKLCVVHVLHVCCCESIHIVLRHVVLYSYIIQWFTFLQQGDFISLIQECLAWWWILILKYR